MTIVKGPGDKLYDIPQNILEEYALDNKSVRKLRSKAIKMSVDEMEDQDVEGYTTFLYDYEGFGYVCGLPSRL